MLLMFEPRRGSLDLEMADVKIVWDVARQRIVTIERDATEKLVVMAGQLAFGHHHGSRIGSVKQSTRDRRIINTLNQNVSLSTQAEHGSSLQLFKSAPAFGCQASRPMAPRSSLYVATVEATVVFDLYFRPPQARLEKRVEEPREETPPPQLWTGNSVMSLRRAWLALADCDRL
jgi:hypothetical protein